MLPVQIGIIGGSGLDDPDILEGRTERYVDTPYGKVRFLGVNSPLAEWGWVVGSSMAVIAQNQGQHTLQSAVELKVYPLFWHNL